MVSQHGVEFKPPKNGESTRSGIQTPAKWLVNTEWNPNPRKMVSQHGVEFKPRKMVSQHVAEAGGVVHRVCCLATSSCRRGEKGHTAQSLICRRSPDDTVSRVPHSAQKRPNRTATAARVRCIVTHPNRRQSQALLVPRHSEWAHNRDRACVRVTATTDAEVVASLKTGPLQARM